MSKLETTIKEVYEDLSFDPISKSSFLAQCTYQRIQDKSKTYEQSFDHYIDLLEKTEGDSRDLIRLGKTLSHLSSLVTSSYEELIKMITSCSKNLFP